jgi:hypothetical protein
LASPPLLVAVLGVQWAAEQDARPVVALVGQPVVAVLDAQQLAAAQAGRPGEEREWPPVEEPAALPLPATVRVGRLVVAAMPDAPRRLAAEQAARL